MENQPIRQKWNGKMTDRERFRNQLTCKSFDRSFNMEFGYWDENYKEWNIFVNNGIRNEEEANAFFNFDKIERIYPNTWMSPPFEEKIISENAGNYIIIDSDGILAEVPKDGHATISHYIKPTIITPDDWKKCKEERFRIDDPNRIVNIEYYKNLYPDDENRDFPLGIYVGSMIGKIRDMLTFEGLCYAIYDYPDMLEDMVETCCQISESLLEQILPHFKFDFACGWEDICFKNGPIVTTDFFKEIIMPRYKRINNKLKKNNIDIWYIDCDGDV
jgi:hypothetical protein